MKKVMLLVFIALAIVGFSSAVHAATGDCALSASLLNQDPIHAVPGEYVKLVFQLSGVSNPSCGTVNFKLQQNYPFSLDPTASDTQTIQGGAFTSQYNSQATIPYTVRVDANALDNNYTIRADYGSAGSTVYESNFSISVENVKSSFDVFVSDYVASTNTVTFDILNTGKNDVNALTVEVPEQSGIQLKGSNKDVVGALDAGQDTTFSYTATPVQGPLTINVSYNDQNGERRSIMQDVPFDQKNFTMTVKTSTSIWTYVFWIVVLVLIGWFVKRKFFKKKDKEKGK